MFFLFVDIFLDNVLEWELNRKKLWFKILYKNVLLLKYIKYFFVFLRLFCNVFFNGLVLNWFKFGIICLFDMGINVVIDLVNDMENNFEWMLRFFGRFDISKYWWLIFVYFCNVLYSLFLVVRILFKFEGCYNWVGLIWWYVKVDK